MYTPILTMAEMPKAFDHNSPSAANGGYFNSLQNIANSEAEQSANISKNQQNMLIAGVLVLVVLAFIFFNKK
jgi:hypothetical protein